MTAKILYWNIENFSNNKIANTAVRGDQDYDDDEGQGPQRLAYILETLGSGQNPLGTPFIPDFIVIVEIERGAFRVTPGYPVKSKAATGVLGLFNAIDNDGPLNAAGEDWYLVPPLVVGRRGMGEGVAVFYNSTNWYFLGPTYSNATYAAPFHYAVRNRQIPANYGIARYRQKYENRYQGQWHYTSLKRQLDRNPTTVKFPDRNSRTPWLTCFGSVGGNPPTLLRLMSVHTSPATADAGTRQIGNITEMMTARWETNQQIDVILGDFNVDNLAAASWTALGAYGPMLGANAPYAAAIRPPVGLAANFDDYYMTEAPKLDHCLIENGGQIIGAMPGYGYLNASIDNAFYRTHGVAPPPANVNSTIINRASGTPYPAALGPPPPYRGTVRYGVSMQDTLADIVNEIQDDEENYDGNAALQEWDNYGIIRSTSDHLPLIFEI